MQLDWEPLTNPVWTDKYSKRASDYKEPDYVNKYGKAFYDKPSFSERIQAHGDNMHYADNLFQQEYNYHKIAPPNYRLNIYDRVRPDYDGHLSFTERIHLHADGMEYGDAVYQEENAYDLAPEVDYDIYDDVYESDNSYDNDYDSYDNDYDSYDNDYDTGYDSYSSNNYAYWTT